LPPSNVEVVQRWFEEVWNQKRLQAMDELADAKVVSHGHAPHDIGLPEFKAFAKSLLAAFPDIHFVLESPMAEGDKVATRWRAEMTHKGDYMGIAPTGRKISISGMSMARIQNGKFVETWDSWDQLGFLTQLGLVTPPALL
jgi:predicted ester cyclase